MHISPPLPAPNLQQQQLYAGIYAAAVAVGVLRLMLCSLSACPFSAFHFTLKIKRNANNANRQLSIGGNRHRHRSKGRRRN